MSLAIIYRDPFLLALDKPSGLLSVPGRGPQLADCLSARVLEEHPTALVVHRLDRDTSGVMLMALDAATQRELGRQFEARQVEKTYLAITRGLPTEDAGRIDLPLAKDFDNPPRHRVDLVHGRPASTEWRVLARDEFTCRLELRPRSGRSHQLRVHLAAIGLPILGDPLYAPAEAVQMAPRLLLHAASLSFTHPVTGERLTVSAPCSF